LFAFFSRPCFPRSLAGVHNTNNRRESECSLPSELPYAQQRLRGRRGRTRGTRAGRGP
jgi:hypothetical protein